MDTFPLSLVCIVWLINQTWQYKPFQIYIWFFTLRVFCIIFIPISAIVPINIWNYQIDKNHGNKGRQNMKISWISMINFIKHVLFEYSTFLIKMTLDVPTIAFAKSYLCLLTNVETFLGLTTIMPLLEIMHFLIKFA